ncbi:MAG: ACP S-malonyltransferase [Propionibacteriaceae bacterium]|jgi:[acyl-carrier-protein] S-malonyltransferase|nr:ACP S-malonyltransferase [Propionibacteriaceae bacterium]
MLAIVSPGQGAQRPGILTPWLEVPHFRTRINAFAALSGLDLEALGTTATAETIKATEYAQPLLVATALCAAHELPMAGFHIAANMVAGHSVGELVAAALSGVLSDTEALILATVRGRAMAQAAATADTGMAAILLGDADTVAAEATARGLSVANRNGNAQVVVGGTNAQLDDLEAHPLARTKVVRLQVAGAFHTAYMEPAIAEVTRTAANLTTSNPLVPVLSNRDGAVVNSGADYLQRLISQIATPVRWDLCMDTMHKYGITGVLELPPSGVLTGLVNRNLPGVEVFSLDNPSQLPAALAFIHRHHTVTESESEPETAAE